MPHMDGSARNDNRIAMRFGYEWHEDSGHWFRGNGNEEWEYDADGLMRRHIAGIDALPVIAAVRLFHCQPGRRPYGHNGEAILDLETCGDERLTLILARRFTRDAPACTPSPQWTRAAVAVAPGLFFAA